MSAALRRRLVRTFSNLACVVAVVVLLPAPAYAVETLRDYVPVTSIRLSEDLDENWTFTTHTNYWSVLGVRPSSGWDVYTDVGFDGGGFVRSAPNGILGVNFVAIDSNGGRRPFGQYFARAITNTPPPNWPGGASPYTIMIAQGTSIIGAGINVVGWRGGVFLVVKDIYLAAGQQVTVNINPLDTAYLFASDMADSATWVQPRDSASARTSGGWMQYTAPRSAWYGLVLVNQRGATWSTVQISLS
jgi:hypothetical protein